MSSRTISIVAGLCSFSFAFREVERVLCFGVPAASLLMLLALVP